MPVVGQKRRFDRLPIISGLPPINGHHLTGPAGLFRANFGLMHRSKRYFHSEHLVGALKQKPV
jgi:hypothetical protein